MRHRKRPVEPFGLIRILALLARLESVLVVQPNLPQAVYVAMVREKDWIPRRERVGHVAGAASDPDMEMVVRPDFQVAWFVRPRVRRDFAAANSLNVFGETSSLSLSYPSNPLPIVSN